MFEIIHKYTKAWLCLLLSWSISCSTNDETMTRQQNAIIPTISTIGLNKTQSLSLAFSPALRIDNELHSIMTSASLADNNSRNSFQLSGALAATRPIFGSAHISIVTLFNQLSDTRLDKQHRQALPLLSSKAALGLQQSGFKVISVSNWNSFDYNRRGLRDTIEQIQSTDLEAIGAGHDCLKARTPHKFQHEGVNVWNYSASLKFHGFIDSGPRKTCAFRIRKADDITPLIRNAKENGADLVVLSLHWRHKDQRLSRSVPQWMEELAATLIDSGVDILIGNGTPYLLPIQSRIAEGGRVGIIAYGLGQLITSKQHNYIAGVHPLTSGELRVSAALTIDVNRVSVESSSGSTDSMVGVTNVRAHPLWMDLVEGQPRVEPMENIILSLRTENSQTGEDIKVMQSLTRALDRWENVKDIIGEEWLVPPM